MKTEIVDVLYYSDIFTQEQLTDVAYCQYADAHARERLAKLLVKYLEAPYTLEVLPIKEWVCQEYPKLFARTWRVHVIKGSL